MAHSVQPVAEDDNAGHDALVIARKEEAGGANRCNGRDEGGAVEAMPLGRSAGRAIVLDMAGLSLIGEIWPSMTMLFELRDTLEHTQTCLMLVVFVTKSVKTEESKSVLPAEAT